MYIEIDFNSDEAIYMQLRNQIIMGIATSEIREGDTLPSVRQLAQTVGINMHTVNKAYAVLRQEGFVQLDRRKGAVIASCALYLRRGAVRIFPKKRFTGWWTKYLKNIRRRITWNELYTTGE